MYLAGKIGVLLFSLIIGLINSSQIRYEPYGKNPANSSSLPIISRIAVLSIHVCDTIVHDSVFHFLTDQIGLPVEYYPLKWGDRKYAGVYAGNMFLEPCGPYVNFRYADDNFKAAFYGLNCESEKSLSALEQELMEKNINECVSREDGAYKSDSVNHFSDGPA